MLHAVGKRVIILGGGVAGLSAAHELIERGFEVEVYERNPIAGGKARSVYFASKVPGKFVPGEHGFRFFPAFYKHIVDTMQRIPVRPNGQGDRRKNAADHLNQAASVIFDRVNTKPIAVSTSFPKNLDALRARFTTMAKSRPGPAAPPSDDTLAYVGMFAERIWQVLTSCERRRTREYERTTWWDFTRAEEHTAEVYRKYLVQTMTRSLIAANAKEANAKVVGDIAIQVLRGLFHADGGADRVLDGPTNDVWIDPWQAFLESKGVKFHFNMAVKRFAYADGRIQGVQLVCVDDYGTECGLEYTYGTPDDYYIAAMPVEAMAKLLDGNENTALRQADQQFSNILALRDSTRWMTGIQFYFKHEIFKSFVNDGQLDKSHLIFLDSPWALTAISQPQFWVGYNPGVWGDGSIRDVVSVIISNWDEPGLNGKRAIDCTQDELEDEVLAQLSAHLWNRQDQADVARLRALFADDPCLDPDLRLVEGCNSPIWENQAPLFINKPGNWQLQPEAETRVANMFLAADYVRTFTQLPTMEAANEAARHAVNGIIKALVKEDAARVRQAGAGTRPAWRLAAKGVRGVVGGIAARIDYCHVWDLHEPWFFWFWRFHDQVRFRCGLPWRAEVHWLVRPMEWGAVGAHEVWSSVGNTVASGRRRLAAVFARRPAQPGGHTPHPAHVLEPMRSAPREQSQPAIEEFASRNGELVS